MSDEPTKKSAGEGAEAGEAGAELPTEVELKVRGKSLKLPLEKAVTLAQQGLVQQQNAERLAAERRDFEGKAQRYAEFQKFTGHLEANPQAAQAVAQALRDPAGILAALARRQDRDDVDDDDLDDDGAGRPSGADKALRTELSALRQEIVDLKAADSRRDAVDAAGAQSKVIDREISDYPWLKAPKMAALAKAQIAQALAASPGSDIASVTAVVASDFREAFEAEATERATTARQKTQLRTERPARGTPIPGMSKAPTKEDLASGKLLGPLKEMARSFGLPVD